VSIPDILSSCSTTENLTLCEGWNWAISATPHPPSPEKPLSGEAVDVDAIPMVTRTGYRRYATEKDFLYTRLRAISISYFALDFLSVYMMKDPYFIFGPSKFLLPEYLEGINPWLLSLYRNVFLLAGVYGALQMIFSNMDLVQYFVVSKVLSVRGELWQQASIFGTFDNILDRGLAGFWGGWWHQTFRFTFTAPVTWAVQQGYLEPKAASTKALAMLAAFTHSGLLHMCGSYTSIPKTRIWRAPLFFALQALGILAQQGVYAALEPKISGLPTLVKRAGNAVFVLTWLQFTAWAFGDDLASTGLWMLEPVPISPLRLLGFGYPTDSWWRWGWDELPRWIPGRVWWESGIGG
jgi:hypothetical protein